MYEQVLHYIFQILLAALLMMLSTHSQELHSSSEVGKVVALSENLVTQIQSGYCTSSNTKAGDVITSEAGNIAKV